MSRFIVLFIPAFFTAQCYASVVYAIIVRLSVCVCICHTPVLYQNG